MKVERVEPIELFRSPILRNSALVRKMCARAGPLYLTDDRSRPGHFTTYFRVFSRRPESFYPSPVLADLYALHELRHAETAAYDPSLSWLDWVRRRIASEFAASLLSECLVYFAVPGLREHTFDHEIWVDRFLHLRGRPIATIETQLAKERRRALAAPVHDDFVEFQIHSYGQQNMQWCRVWAEPVEAGPEPATPAFRIVEAHMARPDWSDDFQGWIDSMSLGGVPFLAQARAFERIYQATNSRWGNQHFRR